MELIDEYLAALKVGDAERVLVLFAPDGIVHSPLYGSVPARQFYPTLFADTAEAKLTLRCVFRDDREAVAFWFDFAWVLADGTSAPFTVVDIAELTERPAGPWMRLNGACRRKSPRECLSAQARGAVRPAADPGPNPAALAGW
jgi:SnoaL-like domain